MQPCLYLEIPAVEGPPPGYQTPPPADDPRGAWTFDPRADERAEEDQ